MVGIVIALVMMNILLLTLTGKYSASLGGLGRGTMVIISPLQESLTVFVQSVKLIWYQYFFLVSTAEENRELKKMLAESRLRFSQYDEARIANARLRQLLDFEETTPLPMIAAQVVGKDPSHWSKTLILDKGTVHGVHHGFPVVVPDGIVGMVIDASGHFSKILLLTDPNSAVDALVQKTRVRGIVKGSGKNICTFDYALRKFDVDVGDVVVSSGLDGVFPKGLKVGRISDVTRMDAGIFQHIEVAPDVDFDILEEVFIVTASSLPEFSETP